MSLQEHSDNFSTVPTDRPARKKPVSERKIQANRKNALRSTGPKTARGKRTVSRNAITHGLLAREVVITAGDGEESAEEFHAMVEGLEKYYAPVGTIEEMLVQTIATSLWRKKRVLRFENGEIRKRLDPLSTDLALRNLDKRNFALVLSLSNVPLFNSENPADAKVSTVDRYLALQAMYGNLREDRSGLAHLSTLLERAKSEIASEGYISEAIRKKIFQHYCFLDFPFASLCQNAGPAETKTEDGQPDRKSKKDIETDCAFIVRMIDIQLEGIRAFKEYAAERESLAFEAEERSFSLPPDGATDKLLRYETHLDRQLYRAMGELERLQRRRAGEKVPPPLNIN
jgi:hypothetical protein